MRHVLYATAVCAALLGGCEETTTDGTRTTSPNRPATTTPPPAPDNTGRNKSTTTTPMDQGNSSRDTELTAQIRRQITEDSSMSTNARNVKIVTSNGVVTLSGVVDTQEEKDKIEQLAKNAPGVTRVDNQIEVKGG